jgi:hypothetical protein
LTAWLHKASVDGGACLAATRLHQRTSVTTRSTCLEQLQHRAEKIAQLFITRKRLLSENIFAFRLSVCWQSSGGGFTALAMMIVRDESHFVRVLLFEIYFKSLFPKLQNSFFWQFIFVVQGSRGAPISRESCDKIIYLVFYQRPAKMVRESHPIHVFKNLF